jgi:hypothetical protein
MPHRRSLERILIGAVASVLALGLTCATREPVPARARPPDIFRTPHVTFTLHTAAPLITVSSADGARSDDVDLALVVDEAVQPIVLAGRVWQAEPDGLRVRVPVELGSDRVDADLEVHVDVSHDALVVQLALPVNREARMHRFALRAELAAEASSLFVSGVGAIAERARVAGRALVLEGDPHPLAIGSRLGPLDVETISEESLGPGEPMRVAATSPPATATDHPFAEMHLVLGASTLSVWPALAALDEQPVASVRGRVLGVAGQATVVGRDVMDCRSFARERRRVGRSPSTCRPRSSSGMPNLRPE